MNHNQSIMYLMMALEEVLKMETPGANIESIDTQGHQAVTETAQLSAATAR